MQIEPLGDSAALVRLGAASDAVTSALVRAAYARLTAHPPAAATDVVPAFTSVTVHYDPLRAGPGEPWARVRAELQRVLAQLEAEQLPPARLVEIPVLYGGASGPDLGEVAAQAGLSEAEVVRAHVAGEYAVQMIGFAPGFPYLGGLDPRLACPRRATPRTLVPAGSVGIGGSQTGVYPVDSPGGWQLIGRTPLALFDALRDPPALLRPGDRVRFTALPEGVT